MDNEYLLEDIYIRIAFFTGENIAHIEFCLQGLLPKILAIYTIKLSPFLLN